MLIINYKASGRYTYVAGHELLDCSTYTGSYCMLKLKHFMKYLGYVHARPKSNKTCVCVCVKMILLPVERQRLP